VFGRSVTGGAPFRHIDQLHTGDLLTVSTGQGQFRYIVSDVRTAGDPKPALPAGSSLLTLITAHGSGFFGSLAPSRVVYVDAALEGPAAPAPTDTNGNLLKRPIAVPTAELPGRSDPNAWPFLVLWLQALIISGGAGVWSWMRWGRWQTWLVAVPIIFSVMWALSQEGMRLVPNIV
jgi:sortase A